MVCRHCHRAKVSRPRGLCWVCFYTPGVRDLYPVTSKYAPGSGDETEAELDLLIEERRRELPPWWEKSSEAIERRRY